VIINKQQNIVINFHQDFMASMHSNFLLGQTDSSLFYWPNHSKETLMPKAKQEQELEQQ
jgi:hypothetical protein